MTKAVKDKPKIETKELTQEELKQVDAILKDPKLILNVVEEVQKTIVGNEETIVVLLCHIMGRLVINSKPTSWNLIVNDVSGSGKDAITTAVCDTVCINNISYIKRTGITDKVLNYWPTPTPNHDTWDGFVLYLSDPAEDTLQSDAMKTLASGGIAYTGLNKDRELETHIFEGKPTVISTTMNATVTYEGKRRHGMVGVESSPEIVEAIKTRNSLAAMGIFEEPDKMYPIAFNELKRVSVIVPFADEIQGLFGNGVIMATIYPKVLDFAKAWAAMHQRQRTTDMHGNVIAEKQDLIYALWVFDIMGEGVGSPLTVNERKIINCLENHNIDDPLKEAYLRNQSGFGRDRCARLLENLCNKGVVASVQFRDEKTFYREVTGYYLVDGGGLAGCAGVLLVANQQNKTLLFSSRNIEKLSSYVGYVGDFIRQFNINRKRDQISPLASPLVHSTSKTDKTPLPLLLESCRSGTSKTPAHPTQPPSKQDFVATFGESILHEIVGFTYKGDCEKEDLVRVYGPSIIETMLKYKFLTGKKILKLNSKISW